MFLAFTTSRLFDLRLPAGPFCDEIAIAAEPDRRPGLEVLAACQRTVLGSVVVVVVVVVVG